MPTQVKVNLPPGIHAADALLSTEVTTAIRESAMLIEAEAKRMVPVATGTLRRSINSAVAPIGGVPSGIVSAPVSYASSVEYGTKPHTPPSQPILRYAERKGGNGWAMWQSIRKKGTKPHPYMVPSFEAKKDLVVTRLQKALQTVAQRWGK